MDVACMETFFRKSSEKPRGGVVRGPHIGRPRLAVPKPTAVTRLRALT